MTPAVKNETIPIALDDNGVYRVGGTRVPLETVIEAFKDGATAEEIVFRFPVLELADVYAVITYYLRRRDEVEAYLREQEEAEAQVRSDVETWSPQAGIRERLMARLK